MSKKVSSPKRRGIGVKAIDAGITSGDLRKFHYPIEASTGGKGVDKIDSIACVNNGCLRDRRVFGEGVQEAGRSVEGELSLGAALSTTHPSRVEGRNSAVRVAGRDK